MQGDRSGTWVIVSYRVFNLTYCTAPPQTAGLSSLPLQFLGIINFHALISHEGRRKWLLACSLLQRTLCRIFLRNQHRIVHIQGYFFIFVLSVLTDFSSLFTSAIRYYYPSNVLGWELTALFLYAIIETVRLYLGEEELRIVFGLIMIFRHFVASQGNKTATRGPLLASMAFALPVLVLHAYYIDLQTYVWVFQDSFKLFDSWCNSLSCDDRLRVDLVINAIGLFFVGLEFIVSIFVLISFIDAARRF